MNVYKKKTELYFKMSNSISKYLMASVSVHEIPNNLVDLRSLEVERAIEIIDVHVSFITQLLKGI